MAGNTATLQIEIKVGGDGTVQLGQVGKALDQVDAAARRSMQGLGAADKGLGQVAASSRTAASGLDPANKKLQEADEAGRKAASGLDAASGGIRKMAAAVGAYLTLDTAGEIIGMADGMTTLSAKIDLATDSQAEQTAVQQRLYAMSQLTRTEVDVNADAFFGYSNALKSTGASSKDVLGVLDLVNKSLKVSGATTAEASSFTLQFKQALSSGVLQGEEFRAMTESNSVFALELAKALDTDIAGLRKMSSEGQLTTQTLSAAFPAMAKNINDAFNEVPVTVEGAMTQVENAFKMVLLSANEATDGTGGIAVQISNLAATVQANSPAIQSVFSAIVTGAEYAVRGVSGIVGVVQTLASGMSSYAGGVLSLFSKMSELTDKIGVTENAAAEFKVSADAAFASAEDLAGKAAVSFGQASQSAEQAKTSQAEYQKAIEANSEQVLKDIDAQKKREAEHSGSIDKMSDKEISAAEKRAKTLEDMYRQTGIVSDAYFRAEADKVLAQVEKWRQAGLEEEQLQQAAYVKLTALSAEAWKKGEEAAGAYLDSLTSSMASSAGVAEQNFADIADHAADLGELNPVVQVDADSAGFEAAATAAEQQAGDLDSTSATVSIEADTAQFDSAMASAQQAAETAAGQFVVNTQSAEELKAAIQQLNDMPTLDPFGTTRAKYQELLQVVAVEEQQKNLERNAELVEQDKQAASDRLEAVQEYYDAQEEAAKEAFEAQKESIKEQIEAVEEAAKEQLEIKKEALEEEKSLLQEKIDAIRESLDQEDDLRSAYSEIYQATGVGGEEYYKSEAEEVYIKAQEFKEKGVKQAIIEQYVQMELAELREKASGDGVSGLNRYIISLENSYRSTGNFSDSTADANEEIKSLEGSVDSLEGRISYLNEHGLDAANEQVEALESQLKQLEDIGLESWFDGGTNAAADLSSEITRLEQYIEELTSKEHVIKLGIEARKSAIDEYNSTG